MAIVADILLLIKKIISITLQKIVYILLYIANYM